MQQKAKLKKKHTENSFLLRLSVDHSVLIEQCTNTSHLFYLIREIFMILINNLALV